MYLNKMLIRLYYLSAAATSPPCILQAVMHWKSSLVYGSTNTNIAPILIQYLLFRRIMIILFREHISCGQLNFRQGL